MRVDPHANLTITLIRRNEFGRLRFVGSPRGTSAVSSHVSAAHRCGIVPSPLFACENGGHFRDWCPAPFPYDTRLSVGLPQLREESPPPYPVETIYRIQPLPPISEQIGRMVDLYV